MTKLKQLPFLDLSMGSQMCDRGRKKTFSDATANPRPASVTSARRNVMEKKSTFTVLKVTSVPVRNNDELLKAVENRHAFIKNKQGIICTNDNYKAQLLKMKSHLSTSHFSKYLS